MHGGRTEDRRAEDWKNAVANQNRRPSGTQTARKGSQSRGGSQATASSARNSGGGSRPRQPQTGSRRPAKGRPAVGRPVAVAPASPGWTPPWLRWTTLGLSLLGIGLSIYLTIAHLAGAGILLCSNHGLVDCAAVTTSAQSELFGIFPVAELGLAFYVFMVLINLPWAWQPEWRWLPVRGPRAEARQRTLAKAAWRLRLGAGILGVLFILYLIYTELITLRTICLWCTYVHITTFVLFVFLVAQATFWGSPAKAAADSTTGRAVR
jgi:uncharacterized membrane protein